jgi:hypothetical protein
MDEALRGNAGASILYTSQVQNLHEAGRSQWIMFAVLRDGIYIAEVFIAGWQRSRCAGQGL